MFKPDPSSSKYLSEFQESTIDIHTRTLTALENLRDNAPGRVKIRWNRRTGASQSVRGVLTDSQEGSGKDIADQFLSDNRELFGISEDASDLVFVETKERRGIKHIKYQQQYEELSIIGAEIVVHIDQANRVQMVNGSYNPDFEVETVESPISEDDAVNAVLTALKTEESPEAQTELVVYPKSGEYIRAYKVSLTTQLPLGDWVFFVNVADGTVVDGYNAINFAQGSGNLYNTNPERDDDVVTAELYDLTDNTESLAGTYFTVQNDEDSTNNAAPTGPGTYDFLYSDPSNTHFDEVMVYYHLSKVAEFFRNLGYEEHTDQMTAHVHVPNPYNGEANYDNAYYSSFDNAVYFGHGDALNDLAKEAAVIYHEYSHSVVHALQPFMGTHEAGALHEGYADYFGCSLTSDPKIGEFVVGQLSEDYLRNLRNDKTYEDLAGDSVHKDGEIWGSTCWAIHEALGRHVTDLLIYESLLYLPQNASFADAADGILQADILLFGGEHQDELESIFDEKKIVVSQTETYTIVASAGTGGSIEPSGSIAVTEGEDQTFTITPDTDYTIQEVLVDDTSVGAPTEYSFTNVTESHTIKAVFKASNGGDEDEYNVTVAGNTEWTSTGLELEVGDVISITATGTVTYDDKGNSCGPEGTSWTDTQDQKDPLWEKPHAGLIGKIKGIGAPFFIGESYTVKAGSSGELLLGVNDYWYQGNSGEFSVLIKVLEKA
jgi:Zn-dependent metalloprotease